jgi:hypothetical protein
MRHFLFSGAIATASRGMGETAAVAPLVALSGRALSFAPGEPGAAVGTIDLAAIAAAADEHLSAATGTEKETR